MGKKNRNRGGGRGRYDEMFDYAGGNDDYQENGDDENYQYSYQDEIDSAEFVDVGNSQKDSRGRENTYSAGTTKSQAAEEKDSWDFIKAKMDQSLSKIDRTSVSGNSSKEVTEEEEKKPKEPKGPNPLVVWGGKMKTATVSAFQKLQAVCKRKQKLKGNESGEEEASKNSETTKKVFSFLKKKTETFTEAAKAAAQKKAQPENSSKETDSAETPEPLPEDLMRERRRTYLIIGSITMSIVLLLCTAGILFLVNHSGKSGKQVAQKEGTETTAQTEKQTEVPTNEASSFPSVPAETISVPDSSKETETNKETAKTSSDSDLGLPDAVDGLGGDLSPRSETEPEKGQKVEEKTTDPQTTDSSLDELSADLTVGDIVKSGTEDSGKQADSAGTVDSLLNESGSGLTGESLPSGDPLKTSDSDSSKEPSEDSLKTSDSGSSKEPSEDPLKTSDSDSSKEPSEDPLKTSAEESTGKTSKSDELSGLDVSALGLEGTADSDQTSKKEPEKKEEEIPEVSDSLATPSLTGPESQTVSSDATEAEKSSLVEETPSLNESTTPETGKNDSTDESPALLDLPESVSSGSASVSPTLSRSENQNHPPEEMGTPDGVQSGSNIEAWNTPETAASPNSTDVAGNDFPDLNSLEEKKTAGNDAEEDVTSALAPPPDSPLPETPEVPESKTEDFTVNPEVPEINTEVPEVNPAKKEEKNTETLGDLDSLEETKSSPSLSEELPDLNSGLAETSNSSSSVEASNNRREAKYANYTSVKDDTFWKISEKFYQTPAYEKALSRYNIDVVPDPNNLKEGTVLQIPDVNFLRSCYPTLCPQQMRVIQVPVNKNSAQTRGVQYYCAAEGDTLSLIAERLLGDSSRWPEIYRLNTDKVQDMDLVPAGVKLLIPADDSIPEQKIWQ